jgi:hypothetical protein
MTNFPFLYMMSTDWSWNSWLFVIQYERHAEGCPPAARWSSSAHRLPGLSQHHSRERVCQCVARNPTGMSERTEPLIESVGGIAGGISRGISTSGAGTIVVPGDRGHCGNPFGYCHITRQPGGAAASADLGLNAAVALHDERCTIGSAQNAPSSLYSDIGAATRLMLKQCSGIFHGSHGSLSVALMIRRTTNTATSAVLNATVVALWLGSAMAQEGE